MTAKRNIVKLTPAGRAWAIRNRTRIPAAHLALLSDEHTENATGWYGRAFLVSCRKVANLNGRAEAAS